MVDEEDVLVSQNIEIDKVTIEINSSNFLIVQYFICIFLYVEEIE